MRRAIIACLALTGPLIAGAAEPVRYQPMPRMELQAWQVDAASMLHLDSLLRGRSLIAVRSIAPLRMDIPKSQIAPEDLHDTLIERLRMRSVMHGAIEVAVPNCMQPTFPSLGLQHRDKVRLNFTNIEAPELMQLLAKSAGLRLASFPPDAPRFRVAIQTQEEISAELLEAYIGALGMTASVHDKQLELRMRPRPAACSGMSAVPPPPNSVANKPPNENICSSIRPTAESKKYPCQYLEQFPLSDLKSRGYLVLTPDSPVFALIEDPDAMLHLVRVGSRLGRDFSWVTEVTRERLQLTRYSFRGGTQSVDDTASISLTTGSTNHDAAGYLKEKERNHITVGRMWLEYFPLGDILLTATEQQDGRWQARVRDVYGANYVVRVGDYLGTDEGRVTNIGPDGVSLTEIISDNLGGYLERETRLQVNTWYESPRAVIKRKFLAARAETAVQKDFLAMAATGNTDRMATLLEAGASLDAQSASCDCNALLIAVGRNRPETVSWLLKHGAHPNVLVGGDETTPLIEAASRGNAAATRLLLDAGADTELADQHENTALRVASGGGPEELVSSLLARGADPRAVNYIGLSSFTTAAAKGQLGIAKLLVQAGVGMDDRDRNGNTMLSAAAFGEAIDVARYLVALGADVNIQDISGVTALDRAQERGASQEFIELLRSRGARNGTH
jgi:ankyrin repeat protein/Tfp pilus assembly protein PilP